MVIEIISSIFFNHNIMRLEINYKKKRCQKHKHVEINNMLLNNQWVIEEIKESLKSTWRQMRTQQSKIYGM